MTFNSLLLLLLVILFFHITRRSTTKQEGTTITDLLKDQFKESRIEMEKGLKDNRQELQKNILEIVKVLTESLHRVGEKQYKSGESLQEKLTYSLRIITQDFQKASKESREEINSTLQELQKRFGENVKDFSELQRQRFNTMTIKQDQLVRSTEEKLEKMRETVDEKLHKTLEERLGQSFQLVSARLEAVQKGLGEMKKLAHDVGDLKTVLHNVKTRGTIGEIQLGSILAQIMAPEQYESNVKIKKGSNDIVEFAVKLPGKEANSKPVYLPIDAKFPQEAYIRLQAAYERGNQQEIALASKTLLQSIKKFAKDIKDKYIDPPHTTDFGIMFLPTEGLFAEVVRSSDLIAMLQRDFKIVITGPTTLAAMLNSLQMGFKTLAIQQRSSQVWDILGAIKTEFGKFGTVLEKAQHKIQEANKQLDKLVGERTRVMLAKLKKVEQLPEKEASTLLSDHPEDS
ncbi:MAG: DNA recombination protein RmuC [Bacteroidota bacterium]